MAEVLCAICNDHLTKTNDSGEHIIPNAIGGWKKVRGFICQKCNKSTGNLWDSELAKELNALSLFLCIKRERGVPPAQNFDTTKGEKVKLYSDASLSYANPEFQEELWESGNGVQIQFSARSENEAEAILKGLKKKYPQLDIDKARASLKPNKEYFADSLKISCSLGGEGSARSVVKTALAMAVYAGISPDVCEHALNYLNSNNDEACFGYFYESDLVENRSLDIPLHIVAIEGFPDKGLLLGYVEYFSAFRVVLCLSSKYSGAKVCKNYAINPVTAEELRVNVNLNALSIDDVKAAYGGKKAPENLMRDAWAQLIHIAESASYKRAEEKAINGAMREFIEESNENQLKPENVNQLTEKIINKLMPLVLHRHRK